MASIPDEFICPITLEIMVDPVLCEDGYTYEKSAIMAIQNSLSPMTRQHINKTKLIPNRALKNAIDRFLSSNTQCQKMTKDYTLNYFEPLMLLAKNIIDLTEEIKSIKDCYIKDKREKMFLIMCKIIYNIIKYTIIFISRIIYYTIQNIYNIIKYTIIFTKEINYIIYNLDYDIICNSVMFKIIPCTILVCYPITLYIL